MDDDNKFLERMFNIQRENDAEKKLFKYNPYGVINPPDDGQADEQAIERECKYRGYIIETIETGEENLIDIGLNPSGLGFPLWRSIGWIV